MKTEEEIIKQIESGTIDYRAELMDFMDITENLLKYVSYIEKYVKELSGKLYIYEGDKSIPLYQKIKDLEYRISKLLNRKDII